MIFILKVLIFNISFKTLFQPLAISLQHLIALKNQSYIIKIFNNETNFQKRKINMHEKPRCCIYSSPLSCSTCYNWPIWHLDQHDKKRLVCM